VLGNALFKTVVYRRFPLSHIAGLLAFAVVAWMTAGGERMGLAGLATLILVCVAAWEAVSRGRHGAI